jgi:hypothetical protein
MRGIVLLLGMVAAVLGILLILGVITDGIGMPALGLAVALLGVGEVLQALDGRTT